MEKERDNNSHLIVANDAHLRVVQPLSSENEEVPHSCPSRWSPAQHIPAPLRPLIGREQEVRTICNLLQQPEIRLLTITGPGGVGKTRLALQALAEISSTFTDEIFFIPMACISTIDLVLSTIVQALRLNECQCHHSTTQVQAGSREKSFLLLLDNFEHLAEAAAQLNALLALYPHLKIMITSRAILNVSGEQVFYVTPLALPDLAHLPSCEELSQIAAVSLFLQRARIAQPAFELTEENAHVVAEICMRLDGLPLALELAAARLKLFSPRDLLARLSHRFSLLTNGTRDAPERHRTLRKTMEWSYRLLTPQARRLFRRLSIFVGGCSLPAIEAIVKATSNQGESLLDTLTTLLDQSLLQRDLQTGQHELRFTMLETIREYASECLRNSDEYEIVRQAHARYYAELTKAMESKEMTVDTLRRVEQESENLRVAFCWLLSSGDAEQAFEMGEVLWAVFCSQNQPAEGHSWLRQVLEYCHPGMAMLQTDTRAQAIHTAVVLGCHRDNWIYTHTLLAASIRLSGAGNDDCGKARHLLMRGVEALLQEKYAAASALTNESIQMLQGTQQIELLAEAFLIRAYSLCFHGNHLQAYTLGREGLALTRQTSEMYGLMRALYAQAFFAQMQGETAEVQAMYEEGLAIMREVIKIGKTLPVAVCLMGMGAILTLQKHYTRAVRLWGKARALYKRREGLTEAGAYEWLVTILGTKLLYSKVIQVTQAQLGKQSFVATLHEGQALTPEQLLAELEGREAESSLTKSSTPRSDGLTSREKEVLALLTQGLSSAQIAEQLAISPATVNTHVRAIYNKLGVSTRSAATRYALEHQLA